MSMRSLCFIVNVSLIGLNSCCSCKAFTIQSKPWQFRGHPITYEEVRRVHNEDESINDKDLTHDPILLLNGFGVGSFHQYRVMPNLLTINNNNVEESTGEENNRVVYGIDYLGQGNSWPTDCNDGNSDNEKGLIYSADTWADQVIEFIEQIVLKNTDRKVHLVGNSVGGYLSTLIATRRPDLVESICLLNATPVWGLNLPGWSGYLPAPLIPKKIGRYLFDRIRDPNTIEKYLGAAYANRDAFDSKLIQQIKAATDGNGGHAAFASILWSPPASFPNGARDFYSNLSKVQCDVLLLFGADDPWCTPSFAKRMHSILAERDGTISGTVNSPTQRYIELANAAHCPNHEAPNAVGDIVTKWCSATHRNSQELCLVQDHSQTYKEDWGLISSREVSDTTLTLMERLVTKLVG